MTKTRMTKQISSFGFRKRLIYSGVQLTLARVSEFHRFDFFAAAILRRIHIADGLCRILYCLAHLRLCARHHFRFAAIRQRLRGGVIRAFHAHDAGAHVIDPGGDKFLFRIVQNLRPPSL